VNTPRAEAEAGAVDDPRNRTATPTTAPVHPLPVATPVMATWPNAVVAGLDSGPPVELDPPNDGDVRV